MRLHLLLFFALTAAQSLQAQTKLAPYFDNYTEGDKYYDSLYAVYRANEQAKLDSAKYLETQNYLQSFMQGNAGSHLTFSKTPIDTLPLALKNNPHVKRITFRFCKQLNVHQVFSVLASLPNLSLVEISHGGLTKLPQSIGRLTQIDSLVLSNNSIALLPDSMQAMQSLYYLDLSTNAPLRDKSLWSVVNLLPSLEELDISYCKQSYFFKELQPAIKKLNLAGNYYPDLTYIPRDIAHLSLIRNRFLPAELAFDELKKNNSLKHLNVSDMGWKTLPANLDGLIGLETLHLADNALTALPLSLGNLTSLRVLNCSSSSKYKKGNQLASLPASIGELKQLEELYLNRNKLTELPKALGQCDSLRILEAAINRLETIPKELTQCQKLTVLNLRENTIHQLPAVGFGNLTNLEVLDLSNFFFVEPSKKIKALPDDFGNMTSLRELYLSDHVIEELPQSFTKLKNLEILDIRNNLLQDLPADFGSLASLKRCMLQTNELKNLPNSMENMNYLEELNLSFNKGLNEEAVLGVLVNLQELTQLNISYNKFTVGMVERLKKALPNTTITCLQF